SGSMGARGVNDAKTAIKKVIESLQESASEPGSGTVKVYISDFDSTVRGTVEFDLTDNNVDQKLNDFLSKMSSGGGTNYEAAFRDAANWFNSAEVTGNEGNNLTYFITDGRPTYYMAKTSSNPLVYSNSRLNEVLQQEAPNYQLGDVVIYRGKTIIDAEGRVYTTSNSWPSNLDNQVQGRYIMVADSEGGHYLATIAGTGMEEYPNLTNVSGPSKQAYEDLAAIDGMVVEAIGMGSQVSANDLRDYDTDGQVKDNIDPADLADAILGGGLLDGLMGKDTITGNN